jgi:hypothetical protein
VVVALLVILVGIGIGVGAYNAGLDDGVRQGLQEAGRGTDVVRVIGPGYRYGHRGFFPFGFILFPLLVIGIIVLVKGAFWRRRWYGPWGPGPGWGPGHHGPDAPGHAGPGRSMFEEWHRQQHEEPPGGQPEGSGGHRTV